MKKLSKMILIGVLATMLLGVVAYAASPAEIYSELTGMTTEQAIEKRSEGKTYGELAQEADVYDEFVQKMLEEKKIIIEERVKDGTLTREDADTLISLLEENVGTCDPANPKRLGREYNLRGRGGNGHCGGQGRGYGRGNRGYGLGRTTN